MERFREIVSYLEDHWPLGLAVVVWTGAAIALAPGTYHRYSVLWRMRRASRRMKELRNRRRVR